MTDKNLRYANDMLDKLIKLDEELVGMYYEMGQILHAIYTSNVWDVMGYSSFKDMIEEELTFSVATAHHYRNMFMHFRRLKYPKDQALKLVKKFGMTAMCKVMPQMKSSMGERAIKARIDGLDENQINFTLTNVQLKSAHRALHRMGATQSEDGRRMHSSEAFMAMVYDVNAQPALKSVA